MKTFFMMVLIALLPSVAGAAEQPLTLLTMKPGAEGAETYSTSLQILMIMTLLSMLPAILMTMTSFTPNHCRVSHPATSNGDHANAVESDFDRVGIVYLAVHHDAGF